MADKSISDALKELQESLRQPNPLEVLGVTRELAGELQADALLIAVKGLYRAHQRQLHPDQNVQTTAQAEKLQRVQAAYDQITEGDIAAFRGSLLQKKKRSPRPSEAQQQAAKEIQQRRTEIGLLGRMAEKSQAYIDGLRSPESLLRVEKGHVLLRPFSALKQDGRLPQQLLSINGGSVMLDDLVRSTDIDIPSDLQLPGDTLRTDLYVDKKNAWMRSDDGSIGQVEVDLPDGWHVLRGTSEKRSMESLLPPPERTAFGFELAGCLDEVSAKKLMEDYFKPVSDSTWRQDKFEALNQGSVDESVPQRFRNRFIIPGGWNDYTSNAKEVMGELVPSLIPGQVLMARHDNDLLVLGRVEEALVQFIGD